MSTVMLAFVSFAASLRLVAVLNWGKKLIECAEPNFEERARPDSVWTRLESGGTRFSKVNHI